MKNKIKTAIIILSLLSITMVSGVEASVMKTQSTNKNIKALGEPIIIELGSMEIVDGNSEITLNYDNLLTINGGSQDNIYWFVMDYRFKEYQFGYNQERWVFKMNISGVIKTSPRPSTELVFEDNWFNNDEGSGEIWVEISGYDLWLQNENFITFEVQQWMDILWVGNFGLVDQENDKLYLKAENFPGPNMTWLCPDGNTWNLEKLDSESISKHFTVKNTGAWETENAKIELDGSSEFSIISGETTISLKPGESCEIEIRFTPQSKGTKTSTLNILNNKEWYFKGSELTLTGKVGKSKTRMPICIEILLEKMPTLQRLLRL